MTNNALTWPRDNVWPQSTSNDLQNRKFHKIIVFLDNMQHWPKNCDPKSEKIKMQKIENFTPRRRLNMSGSSTDSMDVEFAAGKFFLIFFLNIQKSHFRQKNCSVKISDLLWKKNKKIQWHPSIFTSGIFKDYETALFISGLDY